MAMMSGLVAHPCRDRARQSGAVGSLRLIAPRCVLSARCAAERTPGSSASLLWCCAAGVRARLPSRAPRSSCRPQACRATREPLRDSRRGDCRRARADDPLARRTAARPASTLPRGASDRAILLVPGVHAAGVDEPRLVRSRAISRRWVIRSSPSELPDLDAVPHHAAHDRHDRRRGALAVAAARLSRRTAGSA